MLSFRYEKEPFSVHLPGALSRRSNPARRSLRAVERPSHLLPAHRRPGSQGDGRGRRRARQRSGGSGRWHRHRIFSSPGHAPGSRSCRGRHPGPAGLGSRSASPGGGVRRYRAGRDRAGSQDPGSPCRRHPLYLGGASDRAATSRGARGRGRCDGGSSRGRASRRRESSPIRCRSRLSTIARPGGRWSSETSFSGRVMPASMRFGKRARPKVRPRERSVACGRPSPMSWPHVALPWTTTSEPPSPA